MPTSDEIRRPSPHPLTVIAESIRWARAAGHRIRFGAFGVHCVSSHAADRWEPDPRDSGIDPLGAAILHRQPMATDPYEAAAEALAAPIAWVRGFQEHLDGEAVSSTWGEPIHRTLYAAGREAAARFLLVYHRRMRVVH